MNDLPILINNYLSKYGSGKWKLESSAPNKFNNIIVIPAIQEFENIFQLLESFLKNDNKHFRETLLVFVINNLATSSDDVKVDNRKSVELLRNIISNNSGSELANRIISSGLNIGLVDAASGGFELPEKEGGVGLARKIGMDLSLSFFNYKSSSKNIMICLDADCTIEQNYLTSIVNAFQDPDIYAAYVNYEHPIPDNEEDRRAIICYEIFLRYYVLGLKYANSPFAFPTIGSTMICDYESYVKIGGMNKKKAAEDFYFMEKLAKIVQINKIDSTKIYPASRGSWRVPFGTGQRVNRFSAGTHEEYILYDPKSFDVLKKWLRVFSSTETVTATEYLNKAREINTTLYTFLVQNSFEESWSKILQNSKTDAQIEKQKINWFDGFRTLKLIHFIRNNEFQSINMFDALDQLFGRIDQTPIRSNNDSFPSINIQIRYLSKLRELS